MQLRCSHEHTLTARNEDHTLHVTLFVILSPLPVVWHDVCSTAKMKLVSNWDMSAGLT